MPLSPISAPAGTVNAETPADRLIATSEAMLREVCVAATAWLDGELDDENRTEAAAAASRMARWLGSMDLPGEARLARNIEHAFLSERSPASEVVRIAGIVEDIRTSLTVAVREAEHRDGAVVVAVGGASLETDAHLWLLWSRGFRIEAFGPSDAPSSYPEEADCVVVLPDAPGPTVLHAVRERYAAAPTVLMAEPATIEARTHAGWATTVLPANAAPTTLAAEVARATRPHRSARVGVIGREASAVGRALRARGEHVVAIASLTELPSVMADESLEALVVGPDVTDDLTTGAVRRLRTDPSLRDAVVARLVRETIPVDHHDITDIDVVLPSGDWPGAEAVAAQIVGLVVRARGEDDDRLGPQRVLRRATAQIMIERLLVSAHRDGRVVSVAVLDVEADSDVSADLLDDLAAEFRSDDVIGLWSESRIVLALRGLSRRVAVERIDRVIERHDLVAHGARAGIAEFPYDARALDELVATAAAASERSRSATGPRVVGSDWRAEGSDTLDVLIVDADDVLSGVLAAHVGDMGLEVATLGNGGDATTWLLDSARPAPRVLLLDFNLPGSDGLQLLRQLRRSGALNRMRVLMVSATLREDDLREAFELGALDVIPKPFSLVVFDNRLKRALDS